MASVYERADRCEECRRSSQLEGETSSTTDGLGQRQDTHNDSAFYTHLDIVIQPNNDFSPL